MFDSDPRREFIRGDWMKLEVVKDSRHSHPEAAVLRDSASLSASKFCRNLGRRRFDVSTSNREPHVAGDHYHFTSKDLITKSRVETYGENDIVTMIDVDYYVEDLNVYLRGNPLLMYTFNPRKLSGKLVNGFYHYESEDVVVEHVAGGEIYRHKTWNYDCPTYCSSYRIWRGLGPRLLTVYNVDRVEQVKDSEREYVLFTPRSTFWDPFGIISWYYGVGEPLRKRVSQNQGFLCSLSMDGKGNLVRNIKRCESMVGVSLDEMKYQAIKIGFDRSKWTNIGDVEKYMMCDGEQCSPARAALLFESLACSFPSSTPFAPPAPSYQVVVPGAPVSEQGKTTVISGLPQLVSDPAIAPVESLTNDMACVKHRIIDPHNVSVPPPQYEKYAVEFVDRMLRKRRGNGFPMNWDHVYETQDGPLQRQRAERARFWSNKKTMTIKAFQKKEVYGAVGPPRNISTVTPTHTIGLSAYTYAFKQSVLKHCNWYYPCLDPASTVTRLRGYVSKLDKVQNTDFSSFDGTISNWLRINVEQRAYLLWVSPEYHHDLKNYLEHDRDSRGRTKHGVKYRNDGSRLSGSPLTTDGNTMMNAFNSYCGYREKGFMPDDSYKKIGPKYGDDSLEGPDCDVEKASSDLGLKLKCEIIKRGQPCPFLGRVLINPWVSDLSIQDPIRTLRHLHITVKSGSTDEVTLRNRVAGYLVTDSRTPVIGDYCRMVQRILGVEYVQGVNKEVDRRVSAGPWPQPRELEDEMYSYVASNLGLTVSEVHDIIFMLWEAKTFQDVPVVIRNGMKVKLDSVISGKLVKANC